MWCHCQLLYCFGFGFICPFCVSCLENTLLYLLESWFGGAEFSQILLVWKAFYFSFIFEWYPCWYSYLGCWLFSFMTLSMSCHSLLAWRVSIERSAVILMGIPLCVSCCFFLAAFNICFLCLVLLIWLIYVLGCFALGLSCLYLSGFHGLGWLFPSPF